jgi:hypothetical protein
MKSKLLLLFFIVTILSTFSCKKNTTVTKIIYDTTITIDTPYQMPVKTVIKQGILVDSVSYTNGPSTNAEVGSEFYSSDTGTISQLGGLFPVKNKNYTVSLWDVATSTLITSASVSTTDTTQFAYTAITPVHITPNKLYLISLNSGAADSVNILSQKGNTSFASLSFPYSVGNITFVGSYFTTSAAFPNLSANSLVTSADFVFKVTK